MRAKNATPIRTIRTKKDAAMLLMAEAASGRYKGPAVYQGRDPGRDAEKLIKPHHMIYAGAGLYNIPGMSPTKIYTKPPNIDESEVEVQVGPSMGEIVAATLSLQKLNKTDALAQLTELYDSADRIHDLDKSNSKDEILTALALATLETTK